MWKKIILLYKLIWENNTMKKNENYILKLTI
jgi:hypothetical protein